MILLNLLVMTMILYFLNLMRLMKTNRFFALAMMAATVLACQKENAANENVNELVFTASIQQPAPETKATLEDGLKVAFQVNDKIRATEWTITNKKDCKCTTGGVNAVFSFNTGLSQDAEGYYAVYKYQATVPAGSGYLQICNLGKGAKKEGVQYEFEAQSNVYPIQTAVLNSFDPNSLGMVGKSGSDWNLKFCQMNSLLKFELKKDGVSKVVLESLATADTDPVNIAGRYSMQCLDEDKDNWFDKFYPGMSTDNESPTITVLPPTGQTTFPQGVYYIVTRAARNCEGGLKLSFYDGETELKSFSNTSKVQLNRGKVRNLGSFTW